MRRFLTLLWIGVILTGCSQSNKKSTTSKAGKQQQDNETAEVSAVNESAGDKKIKDLIEKLASENSPPTGDGWPEFKYPDDWDPKKQEVVYEAKRQLADLGKTAFPLLLKNKSDKRYSVTETYSREMNHTVGHVCEQIVEGNVRLIGMRYKARKGADGELHMCPNFFSANYQGNLDAWWHDNKDKSLQQMRIDVLKWRTMQEEKIGFPDDKSRKSYLDELKQKLDEVKAKGLD